MGSKPLTPVRDSADLRRILSLPVRDYDEAAARQLAERVTPYFLNNRGLAAWNYLANLPHDAREAELSNPDGPYAGKTPLRLQPEQAFMIWEFGVVGGLYGSVPLGVGKTLTLYLTILTAVERFGCRRPLVNCPGDLVHEMKVRFANYETYFRKIPVPVMFESFEKLWGPDSTHLLCHCEKCAPKGKEDAGGLRPDCMFTDEADKERRPDNNARKRKARFFSRHPIPCVFLTATPMRHSHRDFAHHAIWALKMGAPVCFKQDERKEWAEALDTKTRGRRRPPGVLGQVFGGLTREQATWRDLACSGDDYDASDAELQTINARRVATLAGVSRRWLRTPGFCVFNRSSCDTPIVIRPIPAPPDPLINQAFRRFRVDEETPSGEPVTDALSQHNLATQLGAGLFHEIVPAPDAIYKQRRKDAAAFVREVIQDTARTRDPIDSEANVYRKFPDEKVLIEWRETRDAVERTTIPRPFSMSVVNAAAGWLKQNHPCLVWTLNTWVGEAIARVAGVQFFASKGRAAGGMRLDTLAGRSSAVVSCHSNRRGRDLYAWNRMLYVGWEQSAERAEQLIGRPHRQGQRDPVFIDVMLLSGETLRGIEQALLEIVGADDHLPLPSKLLAASWDWSLVPDNIADFPTLPDGELNFQIPHDADRWRWRTNTDVRALKRQTKQLTSTIRR
jgi:hypothetical protein